MRFAFCLLAISIVAGLASAQDADGSWRIRGRVVDEQNNSVADFVAATFWSSNGKYWNDAGESIQVRGFADAQSVWKDEGVIAAPPRYLASVAPDGRFSLDVNGLSRVSIFAVDSKHERGGIAAVKRSSADQPVTITIAPLIRVTGEVYCSEAGRTPDWSNAVIYPMSDDGPGGKITQCGSLRGKFSFLLPPGAYLLDVYSSSPNARLPVPADPKVVNAAGKALRGIRIEIPQGKRTLDLGVIDLALPRDEEGVARDYSQFYGKEPPTLAITDARGVPKTIQLSDFQGKWVLVDFWAIWCRPCVQNRLPELVTFYEEHAADRDRFEIIAICNTKKENARTVKDYEALTASLVENAWGGDQLPFPVLIDGEGRTSSIYGIVGWPTELLVDPQGRLVKNGDLALLSEMLEAAVAQPPRRSRPLPAPGGS